jgi:ABC-type transporter Mla maintaining outer membrane lipid asymmetry ATPase subunit MlaF
VEQALLTFRDVVGVTQDGPLDPRFPVSFDLRQGEIGIIRGGIRASSLIRLAACRGIVVKGSMTIMGTAVSADDDPARYLSLNFTKKFRTSLGFCHGHGGLIANMTILQNVMLPAHYHSGLKAFKPFYELAKERLREISVPEEIWDLRPCDVPHEFQKRVLLARAVIHKPVILILDEPTNAIPWSETHEIVSWILKQREMGRGILIATSNDPFAGLLGDWMVDLDSETTVIGNSEIQLHLGVLASSGSALLKKQVKAGKGHAK